MLKRLGLILILFIFNVAAQASQSVREHDAAPDIHNLRVGVFTIMPFAQDINGHYTGIAIDIWKNIAALHHWDYTFVPLSSDADAELRRLTPGGDLDVIIGPVSVSSYRLEFIDFTRPFFLSSIGVISKKHDLNIFDVFRTFFSKILFISLLILLGSFIVFIHLLWLFERDKSQKVSSSYYATFSKGMWQNLSQKGFTMPNTLGGRLVTLLWIMFAAALITSINANYTAAMTIHLEQSTSRINTISDLQAVKVVGVNGQANVTMAEQHGISVTKVATFDDAINMLAKSQADAVVCDAPVGIEYLRLHGTKKYVLSPLVIENDEVAFAVRLNSPLRHQIDLGITRLQDSNSIISICRRYIGDEATRCDM